jgi:predicted nucleic acid-binding protein
VSSHILDAVEQRTTSGPTVWFDPQDCHDAELVAGACDRAVRVLDEVWGLLLPADCRVYVVSDGRSFVKGSAPPLWRALLTITQPFWSRTLAKSWRFSGGLSQRYGQRWVIGIKPSRLMRIADPGNQQRLFVADHDVEQRTQHVVCHELAHAAAASHKPPDWLDEGLAMLAVDRCLGVQTVRAETIDAIGRLPRRAERKRPIDVALRLYARAYWLTRYVDEERPGLLRRVLATAAPGELDLALARAFGCERAALVRTLETAAYERYA